MSEKISTLTLVKLMLVVVSSILFTLVIGTRSVLAEENAPPPDTRLSTRYTVTDTSYVRFPHRPEYDATAALTIEAWIYRNDATRCETILSHDWKVSYWLGFCYEHLRFYRSGQAFDAERNVPAKEWTHVAVSYDGTTATFYINGEAAGTAIVPIGALNIDRTLMIGSDHTGYFFDGYLDEVRLWSIARTQADIRNDMFREVRNVTGLVAAFGNGGEYEEVLGLTGEAGGSIVKSSWGVLPSAYVVPRTVVTPTIDGVRGNFEYEGAAKITTNLFQQTSVIAVAHDDSNLYIYIPFHFGASFASDFPLSIFIDPDNSQSTTAQVDDIQIRIDNLENPQNIEWLVGDGNGGYSTAANPPASGPTGQWQVAWFPFFENGSHAIEIRIERELLGDWIGKDGFAVKAWDRKVATGEARTIAVVPGSARESSPLTWGTLSYSDSSVTLPRAQISGRVTNLTVKGGRVVPAARVKLYGSGYRFLAEQVTSSTGEFSFNEQIPLNSTVTIVLSDCPYCTIAQPSFGSIGIQPSEIKDGEITFPACNSESCTYVYTNFQVYDWSETTAFTGVSSSFGVPAVPVRQNPPTFTVSSVITLTGVDLHPYTRPVLIEYLDDICNRSKHIFPEVVGRAADGTWVAIKLPELPIYQRYHWAIYDGKGGGRPCPTYNMLTANAELLTQPPSYPLIYGFGFENKRSGPSFDEFTAVFGFDAYHCAGIRTSFETCIGARHIDPIYLAYWTLYYYAMDTIGNAGSCAGMASTSLLMYNKNLSPKKFDADVLYPIGFSTAGQPAHWNLGTLGTLTEPAYPANLWAEIRKNQGVNLTAQMVNEALNDIEVIKIDAPPGSGFTDAKSFVGNPVRRLNELREIFKRGGVPPVVCVAPNLSTGHCVVPYAIQDVDADNSRILVYDNNYPGDTTRFITVTHSTNQFAFDYTSPPWTGSYLLTIPLSVWQNRRSMPGIDEVSRVLWLILFGSADAHYTTGAGDEWGWKPDGTFVDQFPGAAALAPFGSSDRDTRLIPLALSLDRPAPTAHIHPRRDGDYTFHGAARGNLAQLTVPFAKSGDTDRLQTSYADDRLAGFSFTPQRTHNLVLPRLGMAYSSSTTYTTTAYSTTTSLLFSWHGIQAPAGGTVGFQALRADRGVSFINATETTQVFTLTLQMSDEVSQTAGNYIFGPLIVPSGATLHTIIADWPTSQHLRADLDLKADGTIDNTMLIGGQACTLQDKNNDKVPETCVATSVPAMLRAFLPIINR